MTDAPDYYEEVLLLRKKVEKYEIMFKHAMARMKTITLRVEDCDDIVIDALKDAYCMSNQFDVFEPDYELLKAIQTVLEYYMVHDDWSEWVEMNPMVKEND